MTFDVPTVESLLGFAFEPGDMVRLDFLTTRGGIFSFRVARTAAAALIDSLGDLRDVIDFADDQGDAGASHRPRLSAVPTSR